MQKFRNVAAFAGVLLCLFVAVCPVWGASANTFVLSNEGSGLITKLVNAGYGNYTLYETLVAIQQSTDPSAAGILTDTFLAVLQSAPGSSQIFTIPLKNLSTPGASVAISTDGTVQTVSIFGASYQGTSGIATLVSNISGVGNAKFLSGTITSFTSGGTTYNVFGIAYAPSQTPASVPAASPSSLILLAIGLCAAAVFLMRKRMAPVR